MKDEEQIFLNVILSAFESHNKNGGCFKGNSIGKTGILANGLSLCVCVDSIPNPILDTKLTFGNTDNPF